MRCDGRQLGLAILAGGVHGDDFAPGSQRGSFFARSRGGRAAQGRFQQGRRIVGNNDSKPLGHRQFTAAEFARLSSSMQLTLLAIRRAQLSSRKAVDAAADGKRRRGDY